MNWVTERLKQGGRLSLYKTSDRFFAISSVNWDKETDRTITFVRKFHMELKTHGTKRLSRTLTSLFFLLSMDCASSQVTRVLRTSLGEIRSAWGGDGTIYLFVAVYKCRYCHSCSRSTFALFAVKHHGRSVFIGVNLVQVVKDQQYAIKILQSKCLNQKLERDRKKITRLGSLMELVSGISQL